MYSELLVSSIKKFVGKNVFLNVEGFMTINSNIENLEFDFCEDVLYIKSNNNNIMSFNANQIANILNLENMLKIIMDLDLTINLRV